MSEAMLEFGATAVVGTTLVVSVIVAFGVAARRLSAASRSLVWQAAVWAFWVVPLACLAAHHVPDGAPTIRLVLPGDLARQASAAEVAGGSRSLGMVSFAPASVGPGSEVPTRRPGVAFRPPPYVWPLLWLTGASVMLLLLLRSGLAVRRLLRVATAPDGGIATQRVGHWAETMALRRVPLVLISNDVDSPTVAGLLRPVLLLPSQVCSAPDHLDAALIHELAHILRRDSAMQLLSRLTRALWWWHPLAWLVARRVAEAAEEACDDWVIALNGDREAYARAVTEWAEAACPAHVLACARRGRSLVGRVRRILDASLTPTVRASRVARSAAVLGVAVAAISVSCLRVGAGPAPGSEQRAKVIPLTESGVTRVAPPETLAGAITGQVFLPDGVTPAAGALVFAENSNDGPVGYSVPPGVEPCDVGLRGLEGAPQTDPDGRFSIPIRKSAVRPGEAFYVHVHLAGYAPLRSARVEVGGSVRLVLAPGHSLTGQVVDHAGRPASGVRVAAYWPSFRGGAREAAVAASSMTGDDGRYQIGPLGAGEYDLWATGPEVAPACRQDVKVLAAGGAPTLRLAAPAEIRGRVVYLGTRTPVEGVRVSTSMVDAGQSRNATSDAQGRFVLRGLRPGEYQLRLSKDEPLRVRNGRIRYTPGGGPTVLSGEVSGGVKLAGSEVEVKLNEGQVLERSFPMCDGGTIEGRVVTADGRPVAGADVSLVQIVKSNMPDYTPAKYLAAHPVSFSSREVAKTDADGRFRVEHVWPRSYYLQARSPDRHYGLADLFQVQDRETVSVEVTITDATTPPWPKVPQSLRDELWR